MSFVAAAVIGGGYIYKEIRQGKKEAKRIAAQADKAAAAQTAAIQEQTKAMRAAAQTPPPPPPPAPIAAPLRQAAPGTGTQIFSPATLIRRADRRTTNRMRAGQSLGYGSRL